jgi:solute carrier family 25 (adenine nucleotide translocator) protein 4/5/6/31
VLPRLPGLPAFVQIEPTLSPHRSLPLVLSFKLPYASSFVWPTVKQTMCEPPTDSVDWRQFAKNAAAGVAASTVTKSVIAPIERAKYIINMQDSFNPLIKSGASPRYRGLGDVFKRVAQEQGIAEFWRGHVSNCRSYVPAPVLNLALKDSIKTIFPKNDHNTDFGAFVATNTVSGGLAGAFAEFLLYPSKYVRRTQLSQQIINHRPNSMWDCLVKAAKQEHGFFSLYSCSVAHAALFRAVQFGLNDTLKGANPWDHEITWRGMGSKWAIARVSVILATFVSHPLHTVFRYQSMDSHFPEDRRMYHGTMDCFRKIMASDDGGVKALFRQARMSVMTRNGGTLVVVLYGELTAGGSPAWLKM